MHGYLPDVAAMPASLFFAGPRVPRGRDLGLVDQRSIAPTIAGWLGVRILDAEAAPLSP